MGADSWSSRLVRVREETSSTWNTASGVKGLSPEIFKNDFQRTKSPKVERSISMLSENNPTPNIGAWDGHVVHCGVRLRWWKRG